MRAWRRVGLPAVWAIVAVAVQTVVLSRLSLPGATPDVILVVVVGWALRQGSLAGVLMGFGTGLALDLAPPAVGPVGASALVLAVIGFAVGIVADDSQSSSITPLLVVAAAGVFLVVALAGIEVLTGSRSLTWGSVGGQALAEALYAVALALVVLPAVSASIRRFEPSSPRW